MKESIEVVIDDREPSDVINEFAIHEEVSDWDIERLETGDVKIPTSTTSILVERKTVQDYASSLTGGRLPRQIEEMQSVCENVYVMVDGDLSSTDSLYHTNLSGESIRGHMASVMARKGIPVIPCSNTSLLVDMVVRLARKHIEKPSSNYMETGPVDIDRPVTERLYGNLTGIGSEMAHTLHTNFNSVEEILNASQEQLEEVDGIGSKRASTIHQELREGGGNGRT